MQVSASVYAFGSLSLEETVSRLDSFGVDYLHVDCNDDPSVFEDIARIRSVSGTPIDLHLVTPTPEAYFEGIRAAGVELCCFQYEDVDHRVEVPDDLGTRMGLSIQPGTEVDVFEPYADRFSFIMVMTTTPGQSGGAFDNSAFAQIRQAKRRFPAKAVHVDGGVDGEVSYILRNLDVQLAVSGSYLRKSETVGSGLLNLKSNFTHGDHLVRDFMEWPSEVPMVPESRASLREVLQVIDRSRKGYCLVVDDEQRLCGVITDGDVRRALMRALELGDEVHPDALELSALLNVTPLTIHHDATIGEMLALIQAQRRPIVFLPVTDEHRRVRGAVSFNNLLRSGL